MTEFVKCKMLERNTDLFTQHNFTDFEISKAIAKLKQRKAPGAGGITSEHLINAVPILVRVLTIFFNRITETEYCRIGIYRYKNFAKSQFFVFWGVLYFASERVLQRHLLNETVIKKCKDPVAILRS